MILQVYLDNLNFVEIKHIIFIVAHKIKQLYNLKELVKFDRVFALGLQSLLLGAVPNKSLGLLYSTHLIKKVLE